MCVCLCVFEIVCTTVSTACVCVCVCVSVVMAVAVSVCMLMVHSCRNNPTVFQTPEWTPKLVNPLHPHTHTHTHTHVNPPVSLPLLGLQVLVTKKVNAQQNTTHRMGQGEHVGQM